MLGGRDAERGPGTEGMRGSEAQSREGSFQDTLSWSLGMGFWLRERGLLASWGLRPEESPRMGMRQPGVNRGRESWGQPREV